MRASGCPHDTPPHDAGGGEATMRRFAALEVPATMRPAIRPLLLPMVFATGCLLTGAAVAADGATSAWQAQVNRDLAAREYDITWQNEPVIPGLEPSWHAPNRAHGFRTYFTPEGIRVGPREESEPAWGGGRAGLGMGPVPHRLRPGGKRRACGSGATVPGRQPDPISQEGGRGVVREHTGRPEARVRGADRARGRRGGAFIGGRIDGRLG